MTTAIHTISLSLELEELLKKYKISPSEAFRVGIATILADLGETQFLNRVNLGRKVLKLSALVKTQQEELEKFKNVVEKT